MKYRVDPEHPRCPGVRYKRAKDAYPFDCFWLRYFCPPMVVLPKINIIALNVEPA